MAEVAEQIEEVKVVEKEPLFSAKNIKLVKDPLDDTNPITVQVLGICSALAVTVKVEPAFVMAVSVVAVLVVANVLYSLIRNTVPSRIRMIVQLVVIASLVILVDQILKAYVYDVSKQLSVFVGLIITNCIIMGRLVAFASGNKPWPSFMDGLGNGIGYCLILIVVAVFREVFGSGTLMGYEVIPQIAYEMGYVNNGLMVLPPAAMFLVGIYIWIQRSKNPTLVDIS
ncbi:MAG: NADH:ubiquinone reductase (Na(+)-transporting) subunit D [Bacteroidia bacterium]|nr:NADH:ubiquinone reductase (Na(+)-transporting) subunit D [Bacteroidia bacterium]